MKHKLHANFPIYYLGKEPSRSWLTGTMASKERQVPAPPVEKRREQCRSEDAQH